MFLSAANCFVRRILVNVKCSWQHPSLSVALLSYLAEFWMELIKRLTRLRFSCQNQQKKKKKIKVTKITLDRGGRAIMLMGDVTISWLFNPFPLSFQHTEGSIHGERIIKFSAQVFSSEASGCMPWVLCSSCLSSWTLKIVERKGSTCTCSRLRES